MVSLKVEKIGWWEL